MELSKINDGQFELEYPAEFNLNGQYDFKEIRQQVLSLSKNKELDVIISFGMVSSYLFSELEESGKAQISIAEKLPIGLAFLVMILVAQFGNVRKMLIILTTIPLALIGVMIGLFIMDYPLSFFAQLGILSLAGIVVNNAILLLEQIDFDLSEGKPPIQAIIDAGLYSLAVSGPLWGPMAVSIMGGLIVSTFLTLVLTPVLYSIFFNIKAGDNDSSSDPVLVGKTSQA